MSLTFQALREANIARSPKFRNRKGIIVDGSSWTVSDFIMATVGELGELANKCTHIRRGDYTENDEGVLDDLASELADIQIYLDLLANRMGIDLDHAVICKFNEVSDRVGCDVFLRPTGA